MSRAAFDRYVAALGLALALVSAAAALGVGW